MKSSKVFILNAACTASVLWYILIAAAVIYSGEHPLAYVLTIYISGFCEVGLEKYFYVQTRNDEHKIKKHHFFIAAVVIPLLTFAISAEILFINGINVRLPLAVCVVSAGTVVYRCVFTYIERKIHNR